MIFLPDTNAIASLLRDDPIVRNRFQEARQGRHRFVLSPPVDFEIRRGLLWKPMPVLDRSYAALRRSLKYVAFERGAWRKAAELWAHTRKAGTPIADSDILIAAHAITLDATLITANERHFRPFEPLGLCIENWTQP